MDVRGAAVPVPDQTRPWAFGEPLELDVTRTLLNAVKRGAGEPPLRLAVEDFELSGVRIEAGQAVGMWYPSANRDDAVFEDPYRFDITRKPNYHLAFGGFGAHFCLGANLARWELRAALRALIPILPSFEAAGPPERVPNLHVAAIHRLPVRAA